MGRSAPLSAPALFLGAVLFGRCRRPTAPSRRVVSDDAAGKEAQCWLR
jgi:hypothetical protein